MAKFSKASSFFFRFVKFQTIVYFQGIISQGVKKQSNLVVPGMFVKLCQDLVVVLLLFKQLPVLTDIKIFCNKRCWRFDAMQRCRCRRIRHFEISQLISQLISGNSRFSMACGGVVGNITVVFRSRLRTRYSPLHTMLRGYSLAV